MGNRSFTRSMRRKTQWGGLGDSAAAANLPQPVDLVAGTPVIISTGIITTGGAGIFDEEFTITRTIVSVMAALRNATINVEATVAIGCAVARNEAIAAGVASLPSPEDDPDFEWLYYGVFPLANGPQTANVGADKMAGWQVNVDVHGQRIVRTGQTIVWLAESQGNNCQAGVAGRYLIKLT